VLSQHCRSCGSALGDAAERKLGRHLSCPSTFDEQTMALLKEWRRQQAAEQKVPAFCIFTDATLIALAEARPHNRSGLVKVQGLGPTKADRYGDEVLAILGSESERAGV
jgi:DNA helicase-2/ATP-dependent DNA helicase PcrA